MSKNTPKSKSQPSVINFGCRLNGFEADVITKLGQNNGLDENTIIINSCAVTKSAERDAVQTANKMRRKNPDAKIVMTGCAAQIHPETFTKLDSVDHVLGNDEKMRASSYADIKAGRAKRQLTSNIMDRAHVTLDPFANQQERTRGFVQIQNGCDHRCTFCIIPFGRGNSRSVPLGDIFTQIEQLLDSGIKEIVLTGVDITAFGADLQPTMSLTRLLSTLLERFKHLPRLRLSSIDSVEMDDEFVELIAHEKRLMPHLHLSLQAGSNMILKRMKRRHLREDAISFCHKLKKKRPDILFGADLIAGFPTETEEMFEDSLKLVDECGLVFTHVFPFSPRPGTPAALMPQLSGTVIKERAARLRAKTNKAKETFLAAQVGRTVACLMERGGKGRAESFFEVHVDEPYEPSCILNLNITSFDDGQLKGQILHEQ